jgi:hypothetical protein
MYNNTILKYVSTCGSLREGSLKEPHVEMTHLHRRFPKRAAYGNVFYRRLTRNCLWNWPISTGLQRRRCWKTPVEIGYQPSV